MLMKFHALLVLDKPSGMTSRDVVNRVVRLVKKSKIGHAGTLDPLATGVLVVCLGAATRLVDRIQEHPKGYRAGLRLGVRSDTDDSTGVVTPGRDPSAVTAEELRRVLANFQGDILQTPPKFSAVHVQGRRAYDLARKDQDFALAARPVRIDRVELAAFDRDRAEIDLVCGSGTYVRSLIRDLGEQLGCGALMTSLRRTFIGPFRAEHALPVDQLSPETLAANLLPLRSALSDDPQFQATAAQCEALLKGQSISAADFDSPSLRVAVLDAQSELYAFASWDAARRTLSPQLVFVR